MKAKEAINWKLYQDQTTLFSLQVRLKLNEVIPTFSKSFQEQSVIKKLTTRLLRDAFATETPLMLLDETVEIIAMAALAGVNKHVLLSASYEEIVKATLVEMQKDPKFRRECMYGED